MTNAANRTMKWIRVVVQLAIFILLTPALILPALTIPGATKWIEHIQIVPAILAMTLGVFAGWLLITLIFGRIYCSTICPAGTLMDISARLLHRTRSGRRKIYRYNRPRTVMRYTWLAVAFVALIFGIAAITSILDPYGAFDRVCTGFFAPIVEPLMEFLDKIGLSMMSSHYALTVTVASSIIATLLFSIMMVAGALTGRGLCNTICPVGTTLGFVSRYSIFQMDIETDLCIQCRRCVDVCKSHCIDITDHVVDGSRCVDCFNCISVCPNKAIRYTTNRKRLSQPLMQPLDTPGETATTSIDSQSHTS